MGGGTKRKTSTYLLGTEPEGATAADLDGVDDEINSIKAGFDSLNAQYQATASKYTQNGIIFPDNTQQTTAATSNTMVDRPDPAVTNQLSLKASDNSSSVYSLKTLKAGQGLQITTPENADCLQLGVGLDSSSSVILSNTSPTNPFLDVMIGLNAGEGHNSFNQGKNVCIGGFAGRGGYGKENLYIGYDAGRYITGNRNTYIGAKGPSHVNEGNMLRIGGIEYELITGKIGTTDPYIRFNTNHMELDVTNVPTAYSATYPDRIWSEGGFLRVGPSKAFFVSVSGGLPTYQFNTPLFQPETYIFPSVDSDVASSYDSTTGHVTIPFDGLYLITGRMRSKDYTPAGTEWGVGVHTSNVDGPHFLWHAVNTTSTSFRRTTYPYIRVARFNAQDELRMFVYIAPQTPAKYFSAAGMQILRLSD